MKHQLNIVKSVLATALLLFVGVGAAQAQTATQTVYFTEPGSSATLTTFQRTQGSEFLLDVFYDDNQDARSVVSFNVHWDKSDVTYGGVVTGSIAAVEGRATGACLLTDGSTPAGVTSAVAGTDNTKIGGPDIFASVNVESTVAAAGNATEEASDTDGVSTTDRFMTFTWAQICGDVFAGEEAVKLFTIKFTWLDASTLEETTLGLSQANGGDFAVAAFEGTNLPIGLQLFTLDVDGARGASAADGVMITRYILRRRGATLTADQSTTDPDVVGTAIKTGVDSGLLDVDGLRGVSAADGVMITRYILRRRGATLTADQSTADPSTVATNIANILQ